MKFIHTSDWHLGRQFHNVSLLDDQQAVLDQLIKYIEDNPVDAVVVAGDVYDRSVPPTVAIELLNRVVKRICTELKTPMILISGNHDGAERLGFGSEQMKNSGLHIISNFEDMLSPVVITTKSAGEVALYGMPYNDPEQVRFAYKEAVSTHDEAHKLLVEKITEQFQPQQKRCLSATVSLMVLLSRIRSDRFLSVGLIA